MSGIYTTPVCTSAQPVPVHTEARESLLVVVLYPSHMGTYLGQLSYLFVLYALLPGVAVQIKKLTSVKVLERILYVFF